MCGHSGRSMHNMADGAHGASDRWFGSVPVGLSLDRPYVAGSGNARLDVRLFKDLASARVRNGPPESVGGQSWIIPFSVSALFRSGIYSENT